MKRLLVASLLVATLTALALAQSGAKKEKITIADTAIGFTAATLVTDDQVQASFCMGVLEGAQVRFYVTGDTPTSTTGTPLEVGSVLTISGYTNLKQFKAIRTGTVSGTIEMQCFFSGR
jgi:hypothetical protein